MNSGLIGRVAIFLACVFFAFASIAVKTAGSEFSGSFISWFRFLVGGIVSGIIWMGFEKKSPIINKKAWLLRGFFGAIAMSTCYMSIKLTSSGRAILLSNTYPIFVMLIGYFIFKIKISYLQFIALVSCFSGLLLVFYDNSNYSMWGNLLGLCSGISGGFAVHFMKQARAGNSAFSIYFSVCLFGLLANSLSIPEFWQITSGNIFNLAIVALFALIGQLLMAYGFKYVTAIQGSIIGFLETALTILLSIWWLGEILRTRFWLGALLIILGISLNRDDRKQIANAQPDSM